jgi:hypothetical protein
MRKKKEKSIDSVNARKIALSALQDICENPVILEEQKEVSGWRFLVSDYAVNIDEAGKVTSVRRLVKAA